MTGECSVLRIEVFRTSNLKTGASPMSQKPISELRRRMLEDMAVRKFSEATCRNYIRHIAAFAKFLGRSPDTATADDVRRFQVHLSETGARPSTLNSATSALRFFFGTTLDRPALARHLARVHCPRPLPRVLSPEEVGRLLEAAPGPGLKYKAALSIAYGAGLRVGEVVMLRVSDIDSKRMLIRVEQGKGRKDRHAMLSPQLLELLRAWWRQCRSRGWLFPSRDPVLPITTRQLNRVCHMAAEAAGFHRIRHYGLLAGTTKAETIAKARDKLAAAVNPDTPEIDEDVATAYAHPCPCCGGRMMIVELFEPGGQPQHQPINPKIRIDTS